MAGGRENLKRGRGKPIAEITAERKARDAALDRHAAEDPDKVILELFREASKASVRLYRSFNHRGGPIPRSTIEAARETRQLAEAVYRILEQRGAVAEADEFLAALETRLKEAPITLDERARPHLLREPA